MTRAFLLHDLFSAFESLSLPTNAPNRDWAYPPTDLLKTGENSLELHFALAGTKQEDIEITCELQQLTVSVKSPETDPAHQHIVKCIARRAFVRKFALDEHLAVGNATFVDGLLVVPLERVIPEAQRKRKIAIT